MRPKIFPMLWAAMIVLSAVGNVSLPMSGRAADGSGIRVSVDMPDVRVYFNGEIQGLAHPDRPLVRRFLPAGALTVKVVPPEGDARVREVRLEPGKTEAVAFSLEPVPPLIQAWRDEAVRHFREGRLTDPPGENAFHFCRMILERSPNDPRASETVISILSRLLEIARNAERVAAHPEAEKLYRSYLTVSDFASRHLRPFSPPESRDTIDLRLETIQRLNRPVPELLAAGDRYFDLARYATPASGNALDHYRAVLKRGNDQTDAIAHALKKVREMAGLYPDLIERTEGENAAKAAELCDNYAMVMACLKENDPASPWGERITAIRVKSAALREKVREGDKWTRKGDLHFIARRFTTPEGDNALNFYRKALLADPTHFQARLRVREMMDQYRRWGDSAFDKGEHHRAAAFYENHRVVAETIDAVLTAGRPVMSDAAVLRRLALIRSIDEWLERGEAFCQSEEGHSDDAVGFHEFFRVLDVHPRNVAVREKIDACFQRFKTRADAANAQGRYGIARSFYRRYLMLAETLKKKDGRIEPPGGLASVRAAVSVLDERLWNASLADAEAELRVNLERYRRLMAAEASDRNVSEEMAEVVGALVRALHGIETLFTAKPTDDRPVPPSFVSKIRRLRSELEIEGQVRREKAF